MSDIKFEITPPIEVLNGADPKQIGKSQSALHKARYGGDYAKQNFDADVNFTEETAKSGNPLIRMFVNLTKRK
jgi:hypothetical protein